MFTLRTLICDIGVDLQWRGGWQGKEQMEFVKKNTMISAIVRIAPLINNQHCLPQLLILLMFLHCLCFIWPFCECCVFHHNNIIVENVRDFADSASVKTWKAEKDFQNLPSESALPSSTSIYHHISNWSQPKHPPCSEEYWNNCQCHNSLLLFLLMFFCRCYPSHLCFCFHFVSCSFFSREFKKQVKKHSLQSFP